MAGEYAIVFGDNPDQLTERVNAKIAENWDLQGGLCFTENTVIMKNSAGVNVYGQFFQGLVSGTV